MRKAGRVFRSYSALWEKATITGFAYEVFDLIYLDGYSLTQTPLKHRKELLKNLVGSNSHGVIRYSEHINGSGDEFFKHACEYGITHWTEPKMIAEVAFTKWTSDGSIRHLSFQGLREDKNPKEVVREEPSASSGKSKET